KHFKTFQTEGVGVVLFFLLCTSALVGSHLYLFNIKFSLIRIIPILSIVYFFFTHRSSYHSNNTYYYTVGFFFIYTVYTFIISLSNWEFVSFSQFFNFLYPLLIIYVVLTFMYQNVEKFLYYFYLVCYIALYVLSVFALYEYLTGFHLKGSSMHLSINQARNLPTTFYTNVNDFAVVMTMLLCYFLAYRKNILNSKKHLISILFILITATCIILTGARIAQISLILFLLFYIRKFLFKKKTLFFIIGGVTIFILIIYFFNFADSSGQTRMNLYRYAFVSLFDSYFLGFGINMDPHYFSTLNNYDLFKEIINGHSYLLGMLISSGLGIFILYILLIIHVEKKMAYYKIDEFFMLPLLYILLLFGPSSSTFFWPHYLFFCSYVAYSYYLEKSAEKNKPNPLLKERCH
ncbi:MAG: O-antigen polymerase, partial [Bacteroidales bacterium]